MVSRLGSGCSLFYSADHPAEHGPNPSQLLLCLLSADERNAIEHRAELTCLTARDASLFRLARLVRGFDGPSAMLQTTESESRCPWSRRHARPTGIVTPANHRFTSTARRETSKRSNPKR